MLAACEERILPVWRKLWYRGNELVEPLMDDPKALRAAKRFTELVVTPEFMAGVIWKRSYEKPLGYPGDFQIMNMVYDWRREGNGPYEQLLHRMGQDAGKFVATRMHMIRQAIAATMLRPVDHPIRIAVARLRPGAGSGGISADSSDLPQSVQFTLIDQDYDALVAWPMSRPIPGPFVCMARPASVVCRPRSASF